jgi:hypothetical protein
VQVPISFTPTQASWAEEVERRLALLEEPQSPVMQARMTSGVLTAASAATYAYRSVYLTDLNQIAYSNGTHWYKLAVGTLII